MSKRTAKPQASSARAASTFGGFGSGAPAFGASASRLSYVSEPPDLSAISDPNVVVYFRNLSKKDSTTKAKALEDLRTYLSSSQEPVEESLLEAWAKIYPRTSIDNAKAVRQNAHMVQADIAASAGKRMAKYMPQTVAAWLSGLYDTDRAVVNATKTAIARVFVTPEKIQNIRKAYQQSILEYARDAISKESATTLSDERTVSPDDAHAKYSRVVAASIALLGSLLSNLQPGELSKFQPDYESLLGDKKLWDLATHSDAAIRRSMHAFLKICLTKEPRAIEANIETITKSYLAVGLNSDQTGSSYEYIDSLTSLTIADPDVWFEHYKSKTGVDRRLRQFLKKGSQYGPRNYWVCLATLFHHIPIHLFVRNATDTAELLNALLAGIVRKEEPKYNHEDAFKAYLDVVHRAMTELSEDDKAKVLDEQVLPLLFQYLSPSLETSQWTLPPDPTPVLARAMTMDGMAIALSKQWLAVAQKLIDAIKTSAPEQSKDYEQSQTAVVQHGKRFATVQALALGAGTPKPPQGDFREASTSVIAEALTVITNRNGKPYGAAGVVGAILSQNRLLLSGTGMLESFMQEHLPALALSPSSSYLFDILYSLSDSSVFKETWTAALKTVLQAPESPARTKALEALLTSSRIPSNFDLAFSDMELQRFAKKSVTDAIDGAHEWNSFKCILQSPAKILTPDTTDEILNYLTQSLAVSDRTQSALQGLQQVVLLNPALLRDFVITQHGSKLLQVLLLVSESPNDEIAQGAASVNTSIQGLLSSGADSKKSIYTLIQAGLNEATPISVSVETLLGLALQSVDAGDTWDTLKQVFPDIGNWYSALSLFLSVPPKTSLAITNSMGGSVYLIDKSTPSTDVKQLSRDADGFSAAYRMTHYVVRLLGHPDELPLDTIPSDTRTEYCHLVALCMKLADDNLGLARANGLWAGCNPEIESEIQLFMSQAKQLVDREVRRMALAWFHGNTDTSLITWASDLIQQIDNNTSPSTHYKARMHKDLITETIALAGWKPSQNDQLQELLKSLRGNRTSGIFPLLAFLDAFSEPLESTKACERMCNELVADLTGVDIEQKTEDGLRQLVLLNCLLHGQSSISESIAKQRLVFFVKHVVPWLGENIPLPVKTEVARALIVLTPRMSDMYGEHWGAILTSLAAAWSATKQLEDNGTGTDNPIPFVHASLKLYAQLRTLTQEDEPNDDLVDAWKETEQSIANGLVNLLKHSQHFPDEYHQPLKMVNDVLARQIAHVSLEHLQSTEELYPLLYVESQSVQQAAFNILHKQIPAAQEQISIDAALEKSTARLPEELLSLIIDAPTVTALAEANLEQNIPLPVRGYLLSWLLIFDHLEHASFKVKNDYVDHIKEGDYLPGLLNFTFDILGHAHNKPVDVSKLDVTKYEPGMETRPKRDLQWLLTNLYFLCLKHVPSLTKAWFIDCKSRATVVTLEPWTEKFISPPVITAALESVTSWADQQSRIDDDSPFSIKVAPRAREITAQYVVDEQTMAMRISLPPAFPLANAHIEGINRVAVNEQKWQSWLRTSLGAITIFNGSLIDALTTFKRNVDGAMKGQTECAICYSIVGSDRKLPDKRCQTCKNLFHGSCLFKWFRTSGSSSCPLCRNPFNYG